jgi:hypothetical protein
VVDHETQDPEYNKELEADNALVSGWTGANRKDEFRESRGRGRLKISVVVGRIMT